MKEQRLYPQNREKKIANAKRWAIENLERKLEINRKSNLKRYGHTYSLPESRSAKEAYDEFLEEYRKSAPEEQQQLVEDFSDTPYAKRIQVPDEIEEILVKHLEPEFA